jgi:hypothetical protein
MSGLGIAADGVVDDPNARYDITQTHARLDRYVASSLSGREWELDQVPAVGDPTLII